MGSRDDGSETSDDRVGEGPHVVATMGTRVSGEAGQKYIKISDIV